MGDGEQRKIPARESSQRRPPHSPSEYQIISREHRAGPSDDSHSIRLPIDPGDLVPVQETNAFSHRALA